MFRSWIRSENSEANVGHDRDDAHRQRDRGCEECLQPRIERTRPRDEDDRRRERDHEEVEGELGDVPPQVPKRLADLVRPLADGLVGAEQASSRSGLQGEDGEGTAGDDPVQPAEPPERGRDARPLEHSEDERREEDRGRRGPQPVREWRTRAPRGARSSATKSSVGRSSTTTRKSATTRKSG